MEKKELFAVSQGFFIAISLILLMIFAKSLLIPIFISAYLAMLLFPVVRFLENHKIPRIISIFISLILLFSFVALLLWFFTNQITHLSQNLTSIKDHVNQAVHEIQDWISSAFGIQNALNFDNINEQILKFLKTNAGTISGVAFTTLGTAGIFIIILVYTIMFLYFRDHMVAFATRYFKNDNPEHVVMVISDLRKVIHNYLSGVLKVMVILATMHAIGLYILGIQQALFFAVFVSILYVVPYLGPSIGILITAMFALLTKDSIWYPLGVVIIMVFNQALEANFLTPKIVGSNVSINPITALFAIFAGELIWGIAGMILFIPLAAILKKLFELSPATADFGFLMGEPEKPKGKKRKPFDWKRLLGKKTVIRTEERRKNDTKPSLNSPGK